MQGFPKNPADGDIIQPENGVRYIYSAATNTWSRLEGGILIPATAIVAGLMTADDYIKLNELILPPPQSTITVEGWSSQFSKGIISLRSADQFVVIDTLDRRVNQHTYSFDIKIDTTTFFNYMVDSGLFVVVSPTGPVGPPGPPGKDGANYLPFGPDGPPGEPGANAQFDLTIQPEPAALEKKASSSRAIISITTEEVSPTENYLVVTRANIGNPNACPHQINYTSALQSTWVIALPNYASMPGVQYQESSCNIVLPAYYLDINNIVEPIQAEFQREVAAIKHDCEKIIAFWLNIMAGLFDEQKAALCCALEYCQSQTRNTQARQYIEQSRISAASAQTLTGGSFDLASGKMNFESRGQSVVLDGSPNASGKSTVHTTVMNPDYPDGFGAPNQYGLPNNSDPTGGTACVPGVIMVDGHAVKYDECPPGFIPRSVQRAQYLGQEVLQSSVKNLQPDYTPKPTIISSGSADTPSILYYPPGVPVAEKQAIDVLRSNNPLTSAMLSVTIVGDASLIADVWVYVCNVAEQLIYAYGRTDLNGEIYFKNLSTVDNYKIVMRQQGAVFTPMNWVQPTLAAGQITALSATIGTGPEGSTSVHTVGTCSNGPNMLLVTVGGPAVGIDKSWVSIRYYSTGATLCVARPRSSTSNPGEVLFTGIPNGKWVVYVGCDKTAGSEPYYYTVDPPCNPPSRPASLQASELRKCTVVEFSPRSDGGQSVQNLSFTVIQQVKTTTPKLTEPFVLPRSEFIPTSDERYAGLVDTIEKAGGLTTKRDGSHSSPVLPSIPVELQIHTQGEIADYDIAVVNEMGTKPEHAIRRFIARKEKINQVYVQYFNCRLMPGTYTFCITNNADTHSELKLFAATQNATFIEGSGVGWQSSYIRNSYVSNDVRFGNATSIVSDKSPRRNGHWWVRVQVVASGQLKATYSSGCGAVGPRISPLDRRLCRELSLDDGNPILRDKTKIGDGIMLPWKTSKCGDYSIPDAIGVRLTGDMAKDDNVVLCRVSPGSYTGGFNYGSKSAQIIVEQVAQVELPPEPSHLTQIFEAMPDKTGGNSFRCTILQWDNTDCQGNSTRFATTLVQVNCEKWNAEGFWDIEGQATGFSITGISNTIDIGKPVQLPVQSQQTQEILLEVSANNSSELKSSAIDLPKGDYIVDILDCCIRSGDQYTGHVEVEYNVLDGQYIKRFPNLGTATNEDNVRAAYRGLAIEIEHYGGVVTARLTAPILQQASGKIVIRFSQKGTVKTVLKAPATIPADSCRVTALQIKQAEIDWRARSCIGCVVKVGGQDYIIMVPTTPVYQEKYKGASIAWPTFDGIQFVGVPEAGSVVFKRALDLETQVKTAIIKKQHTSTVGDATKIDVVLFPTLQQ